VIFSTQNATIIIFLPQTHTADLSTYPLLIMPFILNSYDPMSLPLRCVFLLSYTLTRIKHLHTLQSLWVSFHRFFPTAVRSKDTHFTFLLCKKRKKERKKTCICLWCMPSRRREFV